MFLFSHLFLSFYVDIYLRGLKQVDRFIEYRTRNALDMAYILSCRRYER